MIEYTYRYVTCDLCGSNDYSLYAVSPTPGEVLHPQVVRCNKCHLMYANPQITPSSLAEYYCNQYPHEHKDIASFLDLNLEKTRQELQSLRLQPGNMLDVGMGWGHYLSVAQSLGWKVWGTEVSIPFVEYARERFNISNIHIGDLRSARYPDDFFNLVHMWHVLEHVDSPLAYIKEITRILAPQGILLLGVPNATPVQTSIARALFPKRKHLYADFSEHTYHFAPATLRRLLEACGLTIQKQRVYWGSRESKRDKKASLTLKNSIRRFIFGIPNSGTKQTIVALKA